MVGLGTASAIQPVVIRFETEGDGPAEPFLGKVAGDKGKSRNFSPGSDNESFNNPTGIDCDPAGRIYVADGFNNRIQVFSPDGKYLKTIPAGGVSLIQVHKKTGAIYALHRTTIKGRGVGRITKFTSFDKPDEEAALDHVNASAFALDSWAAKPRIWLNGNIREVSQYDRDPDQNNVIVLEENGKEFKKIVDFDEEARKEAGENYIGRWSGGIFDHVNCDPVREQLYFRAFRGNPWVFDLKTGKKLWRVQMPASMNDIAFDKRGYMHVHLDPGFGIPGVIRLDPSQSSPYRDHLGTVHQGMLTYREVPYDYGIPLHKAQVAGFMGGLPVRDQPGAKFFQDGFGVNMRGEIAEQCNIYYMPKMEEAGFEAAYSGPKTRVARGGTWFTDSDPYKAYLKDIEQKQRLGEEIYYIQRKPGIPLSGGTVWTFKTNGELMEECAVIAHKLVVGLQIDDNGSLYFANDAAKMYNGKPFLFQKGGNYGADKPINGANASPVTYTLIKSKPKDVRWLPKNAAIPLEPQPQRPTDLIKYGPFGYPAFDGGESWVEGVEWMYAGLSPGVPEGCTCPATRFHLDWYKRSFLPEVYRRSIGVLDTNGNLIMHFGRYGTLDDALQMKPGSPDIVVNTPRFFGGTDNYLAFDDWGERLVVLKLGYHAEERAAIGNQ
ncbi:MAG: hypothetical protein C0404_02360 [Verrucomicrobia bacterium]|nr:hypothetical protein [Verrucomicrobiota bacterium]